MILLNCGLRCSGWLHFKIERKEKEWYVPRHCLGIEKTVEYEIDGYTNCNWCSKFSHQRIGTRTVGLGNKRTSGEYLKNGIAEIGQNTEKSPADLMRLSVTHTPVKSHQLTLVWQTRKEVTIIISEIQKGLWQMKLTVIFTVVGALATVLKTFQGDWVTQKEETRPSRQ